MDFSFELAHLDYLVLKYKKITLQRMQMPISEPCRVLREVGSKSYSELCSPFIFLVRVFILKYHLILVISLQPLFFPLRCTVGTLCLLHLATQRMEAVMAVGHRRLICP
jgi:hypothetical protein